MAENKLKSLSEIFNNKFFRIPDYQRGYSWTEDQLNDFWIDLENLALDKFHYTGVLTVEPVSPKIVKSKEGWEDDLWLCESTYKPFYIIDGQQRLATIIILVNEILNRFGENDRINFQKREKWQELFLYQQCDNYKSFLFGYEKDNPSDEYFKTKILEQVSLSAGTTSEDTLYTSNLGFAKKFFKNKTRKYTKKQLEDLFKKITSLLKFNFYEIDSDLDVFVAFETMNNRGKQLTKLELLKNRLIYLTTLFPDKYKSDKDKLRKDINEAWKTIYEYLGKNIKDKLDDDDFLRNHWIMYFKFEKSEAEAFSRFLLKEYFTVQNLADSKITIKNIKYYVESISNSVIKYYYINNPGNDKSGFNLKTINYLDKIKRLSFGSFLPLILAASTRKVEESDFQLLLKSIEKFIFLIFRVSRRPSHTQSNHFFKKSNEFFRSKCTIKDVINDINSLIDDNVEGWFDINAFKLYIEDLFKKRNEQGYYGWNSLKYFLYEYELYLQKKANPKIKWEDINQESIEHILPQNMNEAYWRNRFGEYTTKEKKYLLNSLGNLLLLSNSKNSEYQNHSFKLKKIHKDKKGHQSGYHNGSYSEIEVSQESNWTSRQILDRGLKLLEFMEKNWNVDIGNRKQKKEILYLDSIF